MGGITENLVIFELVMAVGFILVADLQQLVLPCSGGEVDAQAGGAVFVDADVAIGHEVAAVAVCLHAVFVGVAVGTDFQAVGFAKADVADEVVAVFIPIRPAPVAGVYVGSADINGLLFFAADTAVADGVFVGQVGGEA